MAHLRYYFGRKDGKVFFDSVVCTDEAPAEPENFLKWYEAGDWEQWGGEITNGDSPVFADRAVTFPLQ